MKPSGEPSPSSRERELFLDALEKDPRDRAAFLAAECKGDAELRRRVEELLREQDEMGSFLETPAMTPGTADGTQGETVAAARGLFFAEKPGDQIGPYKLLQQIGEGGCGIVYMAEQEKPVRRRVALKVIKMGMDTKSVIARFEAERQALALMDHPNIAKVLDAGATETGRPFFVMELVRGIKITEYCDQNSVSARERLELFITVCNAIQHAHQKGIIHRDIKPSNILVTLHDGKPVPKVIDFGIAKATEQRLTEKTLFTEFQAFIGTPAYMSPEQAEMSGLDIDTRSDIYSLGVLLYQLLTGKTPFDADSLFKSGIEECRRTIREEEPPKPSTRVATMLRAELTTTAEHRHTEPVKLIQLLRGDLDWIVMKCLEKDRTRRYSSAHELALDVQRYLNNEPVEARSPTTFYRLQKFVRRNRAAVATGVSIAVVLVVATVVSTILAIRAKKAEKDATDMREQERELRKQAEQDRTAARLNLYVADMNLAHQSLQAGNYGRAVQLVEKHRPKPGEPDLRGFEWRYLWQLCQGDEHSSLPNQESPILSVSFSPKNDLMAVISVSPGGGMFGQTELTVWNWKTRKALKTFQQTGTARFSSDGEILTTSDSEGLHFLSTTDWTKKASYDARRSLIQVSPNGAFVAISSWNHSEDELRIIDIGKQQQVHSIPRAGAPMAFSRDGGRVLTDFRNDSGGSLLVWDVATGKNISILETGTSSQMGRRRRPWDRLYRFSPDGRYIVSPEEQATAAGGFVVRVWSVETGEIIGTIPELKDSLQLGRETSAHVSNIRSVEFSPDGKLLLTGSLDHSVRLWDFEKRQFLASYEGNFNEVWAVAFSEDGQWIASGSKDGSVKIWPKQQRSKEDSIAGDWMPLSFSADAEMLALASPLKGILSFINVEKRQPKDQISFFNEQRRIFGSAVPVVDVDLKTIALLNTNRVVEIFNRNKQESFELGTRDDLVALSNDGRLLVTRNQRDCQLWDLGRVTNVSWKAEADRVLFSPDDRLFVTAARGGKLQVWNTQTLTLATNLPVEPFFLAMAFLPASHTLAVGADDHTLQLWDLDTGTLVGSLSGHKQPIHSVAFSPDAKTAATSSPDSTIKLWNLQNHQELLTIRRPGGLQSLCFSPNGRYLIGRTRNGGGPDSEKVIFYSAPSLMDTDAATVR